MIPDYGHIVHYFKEIIGKPKPFQTLLDNFDSYQEEKEEEALKEAMKETGSGYLEVIRVGVGAEE